MASKIISGSEHVLLWLGATMQTLRGFESVFGICGEKPRHRGYLTAGLTAREGYCAADIFGRSQRFWCPADLFWGVCRNSYQVCSGRQTGITDV